MLNNFGVDSNKLTSVEKARLLALRQRAATGLLSTNADNDEVQELKNLERKIIEVI